ncbi:MAG: maltose alpha-D-glucosyltransferase [Isosphaeraceae bacterium]
MSASDSLWYKDAVIYEVHVRAFADSFGHGHGDFQGLTTKLDYLRDLGITAVWLLPFYPSPLKDDGYDTADYTSVHPLYGKLEDFQAFLEAAHERGIRVITELVLNHTSDQHPWFQRARRAPAGSPERDFYVWSDNPEKYAGTRVIFQDFEPSNWSWDPVAKAYYWHRFYSHQPDLNYDNPAVWQAILPVVEFWFAMGVDGLRLDAVPYLYEREGTDCENLAETHTFLKALRAHIDARFADRMLLAEANQWPEDAVAYFGQGDECHMAFHFPLMPRLFMALHQEDRFPIHDIMEQTPAIPATCQWCLFLRNHDELTLEMVTDEERDYMYRAYTQDRTARINLGIRRRLAPLLRKDRRRIELLYALLFSLPGTPVIYYGDEIGMGDNIYLGDRNGVRTPMQWSADRNAGFSRANPQRLYLPIIIDPEYHYETVNVEAQQSNPSSLLWWVKRLITTRKRFRAFGRGSFELLRPENPKVLAYIREFDGERILVVANLSRFVQFVRLDLKAHAGIVPEEVLGRTPFPRITEEPYLLTLGPHSFIWFSLSGTGPADGREATGKADTLAAEIELPELPGNSVLARRFRAGQFDELDAILPDYLVRSRQIDGPSAIASARVLHAAAIRVDKFEVWFLLVRVDRREGNSETLSLGLVALPQQDADSLLLPWRNCALARLHDGEPGLLCDALAVPGCARGLLRGVLSGRSRRVEDGAIEAIPIARDAAPSPEALAELPLSLRHSDRNNRAIVYGDSYVFKVFRRIEEGIHPDLEIGRYLASCPDYRGAAPVYGSLEYRRGGSESYTLGVLHGYVANQGTVWQFTLDQLSQYFERVAARSRELPVRPPAALAASQAAGPDRAEDPWRELIGGYLDTAHRLGVRTAELHRALAANCTDPAFAPEPLGKLYQRSLYQSMRNLTGRLRERLTRHRYRLAEPVQPLADRLIAAHDVILHHFRLILDPALRCQRIRCHGDYQLAQLLFTGKDFVIIDFEGDTHRTIGERRVKQPALRDVACMLRSFDYAAHSALLGFNDDRGRSPGMIRPEDRSTLEPWAHAWYNHIASEFVHSYTEAVGSTGLIPQGQAECQTLLDVLTLEKALNQIDSELSERLEWVEIPLRSVVRILGAGDH